MIICQRLLVGVINYEQERDMLRAGEDYFLNKSFKMRTLLLTCDHPGLYCVFLNDSDFVIICQHSDLNSQITTVSIHHKQMWMFTVYDLHDIWGARELWSVILECVFKKRLRDLGWMICHLKGGEDSGVTLKRLSEKFFICATLLGFCSYKIYFCIVTIRHETVQWKKIPDPFGTCTMQGGIFSPLARR